MHSIGEMLAQISLHVTDVKQHMGAWTRVCFGNVFISWKCSRLRWPSGLRDGILQLKWTAYAVGLQSHLSGSADAMWIHILRPWLSAAVHFQSILAETPTAQVRTAWPWLHCLPSPPPTQQEGQQCFFFEVHFLHWQSCSRHSAFTNCKST
jgi:hypothetical protein